jgi:hypothetical protein
MDIAERNFYEIEATNQGWSVPELKRQKASALYERLELSRDKDGIRNLATEGQLVTKPDANPTVGLLLVNSRREAIVELILPQDVNIHARAYQLYLPSKALLRRKLIEWTEKVLK